MRDDDPFDDQSTPTSDDGCSADMASTGQSNAQREPVGRKFRPHRLRRSRRARVAVVAGAVCCLGLVTAVEARLWTDRPLGRSASSSELVNRAGDEHPSRALDRTPAVPAPSPTGSPTAAPVPSPTSASPTPKATPAPKKTKKKSAPRKPVDPGPVAGLTVAQMTNAKVIVRTGRAMGVPRRALVVAVATAMQESNLYNLASGVYPESQNLPNQGIGWDHDSVGLFQQRPSMGWGTVEDLMTPAYATHQFLTALLQVPGWESMRLTDAAQAVQMSAFGELYAQHEPRATVIVNAIVPPAV